MTTQDDPFILGRQVELLFRNLRLGQITSIVNASFLTWIAWGQVDHRALIAWLAMVWLVAGLRLLSSARYFRCGEENRRQQAADWHRQALIGAGCGGLVWAAGALLLMTGSDTTLQLFTAFIMAGMIAGAVPVLAADRPAFRLYAWPIVLAVAFGYLWFKEEPSWTVWYGLPLVIGSGLYILYRERVRARERAKAVSP